jgi:O-antigen/teichoic acid export membrane protein
VSNARTYARNLFANVGGHVAGVTVLFFLSPFVVNTLGDVGYGIWTLLNVFTGYMGVLDLGIRASTGRYVVLYVGKEQHERVNETIKTSMGLYSMGGVLFLLVAFVLGVFFPTFFSSIPPEHQGVAKLLLPLMAVNLWLTAYAVVFSSVLAANDRFDLVAGIDVLTLALRTAAIVAVLKRGLGLEGLVFATIGGTLVTFGLNAVAAYRVFPSLSVWPPKIARRSLRELVSYGIAAFVSAVAVRIIGQTDLVIVGAAISVSAVTAYSVGSMLLYYWQALMNQITRTFFPPVQRAVARGAMGPARWLFFRQVRLGLLCGLPAYVGFIIYGHSFIRLWMMGPEFSHRAVETAAMVMAILAGSKLLHTFLLGWDSLLSAMGYVAFTASVSITEAIVNLGLSLTLVLVFDWGLAGVAAGTFLARLVVSCVALPWYGARKSGIDWFRYCTKIGGSGLLAAGLFAGWCWIVRESFPTDSWTVFATQVAISLAGYLPIAYWILLPAADRKRLWGLLNRQATPQETETDVLIIGARAADAEERRLAKGRV